MFEITKEMRNTVMGAVMDLTSKKGAENKMVSSLEIAKHFGDKADRLIIEAVLNKLIGYKVIRYYEKEYEGKQYRYYGSTEYGREQWNSIQRSA